MTHCASSPHNLSPGTIRPPCVLRSTHPRTALSSIIGTSKAFLCADGWSFYFPVFFVELRKRKEFVKEVVLCSCQRDFARGQKTQPHACLNKQPAVLALRKGAPPSGHGGANSGTRAPRRDRQQQHKLFVQAHKSIKRVRESMFFCVPPPSAHITTGLPLCSEHAYRELVCRFKLAVSI